MPKINVLKPFTFTPPVLEREGMVGLPQEIKFNIGEHEVDDVIADHPWIAKHFADGHIESPAQARLRLEAVAKKAREDAVNAELAIAMAEQATTRVTGAAQAAATDSKISAEDLHRPVSELRQRQGAALNQPIGGKTLSIGKKSA